MAGKTLPGIGEDESGEHEAADTSDSALRAPDGSDTSDSGVRADKTPSRATDRMPIGVSPAMTSALDTKPLAAKPAMKTLMFNGPIPGLPVDEDKVAEGLKKLRSLDEPLGAIPSTMPVVKEGIPTLKEGIPAVSDVAPPPVTPASVSAAELIRARGTAHGHALSAPGIAQGVLPVAVDDRLKGTLLGHSLHLPDLPGAAEESNRSAEVRPVAGATPGAAPVALVPSASAPDDFSRGDARFFESEPLGTEIEPEHPRSTKVVRGVAIFAAVLSVFVVAAFAWIHAHKSETAQPAQPSEAEAARAPAAEPTATPTPENTPAVAPAEAPPATATPPSPAAAVVPPPAPAAEEPARAPAEPEPPAESPTAKLKRQVSAANAAKAASPPTPSARPAHTPRTAEPPRSASPAKPAATPGKRAKAEEDPDGTLPLTE
jgi:hypothetical protein